MKINIKNNDDNYKNIPSYKNIIAWINSVSNYILFKELNIIIVSKKKIKYLNNKYKKINKYTNVLTFKYNMFNLYKNNFINYKYIGDIYICKNIIEQESKLLNIKLFNHWAHIIVHSCLHLLGLNHNNYYNKKRMLKIENKFLNKIGIFNIH